MKHIKSFSGFVNEGRAKKPMPVTYQFLKHLNPKDHDSAIAELDAAGIPHEFTNDWEKKNGNFTVDKNSLSKEQNQLLDKWETYANNYFRQHKNVTHSSKNPKDIEKVIMELPDTTQYISIQKDLGPMQNKLDFSPEKNGKRWREDAIKLMYSALKEEKDDDKVSAIELLSHTTGDYVRGYSSWYVRYHTASSDDFGDKMSRGYYGRLD